MPISPNANGVVLLVVSEHDIALAQDIEISSGLLRACRELWPDAKTLLPVSGSIYEHLKDGTLELVDVKQAES